MQRSASDGLGCEQFQQAMVVEAEPAGGQVFTGSL